MLRLSRCLSLLSPSSRSYASLSSSPINPTSVGPFQVFDRNTKRLQKDRAASRNGGENSRTVDYVREEVAERLIERFMVRLSQQVQVQIGGSLNRGRGFWCV